MPRIKYTAKPGDRYGRLTLTSEGRTEARPTPAYPNGSTRVADCRCDCGNVVTVAIQLLVSGNTASCGCLRREMVAAKNLKHGQHTRGGSTPPEYYIWKTMRARCTCPTSTKWADYGGRGIRACERWSEFSAFYEDMGPRPSPKHSIDRIDNEGHYEPSNCRWSTASEQARNKRNSRFVDWAGFLWSLPDLADHCGLDVNLIARRLDRGWTVDRAITERPVLGRNQYA